MSQAPGDFKVSKRQAPQWNLWQKDFADACKQVSQEPGGYNRLIRLRDSYDAGGKQMAEVDGDFIWLCSRGRAFLVEAKFSEVHESLVEDSGSLVNKRQRSCHMAWSLLEHRTLLVFRSEPAGCIEIWDGADLFGRIGHKENLTAARWARFEDTKKKLEDAVRAIAHD